MRIEKGIPIPSVNKPCESTVILRSMKYGESVSVETYSRVEQFYRSASNNGMKITVRKIDAKTWRIWKVEIP